jgi:hypothetical protein
MQIAAALQAEKLILMTDVPGVLKDKDDVSTKFASLNIRECRKLTEDGIIAGGMIPKVQCCIRCLSQVRIGVAVWKSSLIPRLLICMPIPCRWRCASISDVKGFTFIGLVMVGDDDVSSAGS